ncbi:MAG: hypothetical protein IPH45_10105 [Bacteroidales bacterium]|nr:hypothetical protein [Bacteroidales bacterium]
MFSSTFFGVKKKANNWYFGSKAGISFNSGQPMAIATSQMDVIAGCATISDSTGNLLFYTNGVDVWNKNNLKMPNGFGLKGDPVRSTQSSVIVPKPGSHSMYYIFTVDASYHDPGQPPAGLNYSVVDMLSDNGNGDVIQKNRLLNPNAFEKLTAVVHSNNHDIWLISRVFGDSKYVSYLVTSSGITTTPIESQSLVYFAYNEWGKGYLRVSP